MEAGGYTWWHQLRLFHGLIYLCASIYILYNLQNKDFIKYASIPLFIDVWINYCISIFDTKNSNTISNTSLHRLIYFFM